MKDLISIESYFAQCSDAELYSWCVMFLNGYDPNSEEDYQDYQKFEKEVESRDQYLKDKIEYLWQVI